MLITTDWDWDDQFLYADAGYFRRGEVPMAANPPVLSAVLPPSPVKKVEPALALIWVVLV